MRVSPERLNWKGNRLMIDRKWSGASIVPDQKWPNMWRIEYPTGKLSDMVNKARAKDAATRILMAELKSSANTL